MAPNPLLLPAFVAFDTIRAILLYSAVQSGAEISLTFVTFCAELLKVIVSVVFLCSNLSQEHGELSFRLFLDGLKLGDKSTSRTFSYGCYAIPAFLYFLNGLLYLFGLQLTTPSLLHVATLAKIPITAFLHHYLIKSQRNSRAWLSLATLCVGLMVFQMPQSVVESIWSDGEFVVPTSATNGVLQATSGSLVGLAIAIFSAFASTYTEVILKQPTSFWAAQFWLYLYGTSFAGLTSFFWDGSIPTRKEVPSALVELQTVSYDDVCINVAVIVATATTGLMVATILRKRDNLVKLIGTAAGMVALVILQCLLFPELQARTLTVQTVLGAGIIAISTWTYNYYKEQQPYPYLHQAVLTPLYDESDSDSVLDDYFDSKKTDVEISIAEVEDEQPYSYFCECTPTPTTSRLLSAIIGVAALAVLACYYHPIVS